MELMCRTCLKTNRGTTLASIFDYSQTTKPLSYSLMELTSIKIMKDDGLPVNICNSCLKKLNSAHEFKQMVIESDRKLRQTVENEKKLHCIASSKTVLNEANQAVKNEEIDLSASLSSDDQNKTEDLEVSDCKDTLIKYEDLTEELDFSEDCKTPILTEDENDVAPKSESTSNITDDTISLDKLVNRGNQMLTSDKNVTVSNSRTKKKGYKRYNSFNEEQLKLLDNPDCKRIMESELTRTEKSRSKVFCNECNRTLTFRYYVETHVHTHTGNLPFKCSYCSLSFPKEYHLKKHLRIHSEKKEFTCEECGKAFTTMPGLRTHKVMHSNDRPHKCNICDKSFKLKVALRNHKLYHDKKEFVCEDCGKSYFQKLDLINHQVTHSTDQKVACTTCGKLFAHKGALYRHLKRHLDVKPYACTTCSKRFSEKALLDRHIMIHTGIKPYACKICGKKFRQPGCVPRHMRIHTGETPYPCKLCSATFKYSHHLQNHMKKHDKKIIEQEKIDDSTA